MEIKEIEDKKIWEGFLENCAEKTFLQSWSWGVFHESLGNKVWRFGVYENTELISVALTIKISAKRGSFLLVPHGPAMEEDGHDVKLGVLKALQEKLKSLARQEKADFIRVSPIMKRTKENMGLFKQLGFRQGPLHYHPESSWKLDITPTEEQLMDGMRKTTRYLVKQAQQNRDIEIIKSTNVADMDIFYRLHTPVAKLQKFVPFSLEYLKKEFEAFLQDGNIALYFAKYSPPHQTEADCVKLGHKLKSDPLWCGGKGEYIATSFEIFYSGIGFYHHAALLPEFKKIPVSALLQWEAIKEAKQRGCKTYDFWGYADPVKNPKHPYSGPTLFKMGFGGYVDEYIKTQDYVISPMYWINYMIELARKIKRGL
ncbi:MAG: peptidoglycan bridge formation glycyltransferase FemA/FemB family protein [bacterium]|nr:peptidoglycan bridge formation glycyltransferase FemA/FemB family protein [bacterium]